MDTKWLRFGDSSTNQLGKLPLPSIGNMRELANMMGKIFSTCREFSVSWLLLLYNFYIFGCCCCFCLFVFSHVLSKLTSELISPIA